MIKSKAEYESAVMEVDGLALELKPYLIGPPWHEDLIARFPSFIQREIAERSAIQIGHHYEFGFFALTTTETGSRLLWREVDPNRKIITPEVDIPQPARDPRGHLTGWVKFCPCCGANLRVVTPDDGDWGDFCAAYRLQHGTEWFLCTGMECVYRDIPLVLHNPVRGWDKPPGDNWAIGYVK